MKETKKSIRKMLVILSIAILGAVVASGAILSYFVEFNAHITSEGLSIEWDGVLAEDLDIDENIDLDATQVITIPHTIEYVGSTDTAATVTVNYAWTTVVGITAEVLYLGSPVTSMILTKGVEYDVDLRYTGDMLLTSGNYLVTLTIS